MRVVSRVDAGGVFAGDVLLEDDWETPENCVEARPPAGLYSPKWNGSGWFEGRPAGEVLAALKAAKRAELETAFASECEASFPSLWAALGVIAASPQDARVTALKARAAKLQTRLAAVEGAATIEAVRAVAW